MINPRIELVPTCPDCGWQVSPFMLDSLPSFCPDCDFALSESGIVERPYRRLSPEVEARLESLRAQLKDAWPAWNGKDREGEKLIDKLICEMRNARGVL